MAARKRVQLGILFTCVGRRVALVESFRRAAGELGVEAILIGADAEGLSPALAVCDVAAITPRIDDPAYIDVLLELVKAYGVKLIVPTIDPELPVMSANAERFAAAGAKVLVSSPEVVDICQDKRRTYEFLRERKFGVPRTWWGRGVSAKSVKYPVFIKPWHGSASKGIAVARDAADYQYILRRQKDCLVQELIEGREYTCDAYVDFSMRVRCVVPRRRIEVRGGEVSKGVTERWPALISDVRRVVEALGAGPGVVTIQAFRTAKDEIKYIEINPRVGGGIVLSIAAGADFPRWLIQEALGVRPAIRGSAWQKGLHLLRYDAAVWLAGDVVSGNGSTKATKREERTR